MTTVAVTGASGKLGRDIVLDLHEDRYRMVALARCPTQLAGAVNIAAALRHHARDAAGPPRFSRSHNGLWPTP